MQQNLRFPLRLCSVAAALCVAAGLSWAQPPAMLSTSQMYALYGRSVDLMEAAGVISPELSRASAPVVENARQTIVTLRSTRADDALLHYEFLASVRSFLLLADTLPKPNPYPEVAAKQMAELRDNEVKIENYFSALLARLAAAVHTGDRDDLHRYAAENAKVGPKTAGKPRVVFFGDSITDSWHLNEYFGNQDYLNRGISGQITGQMLGRMMADVVNLKPDAMILLAGTNDIARGVSVEAIENNITMIADLADTYRIKPIFCSILPVDDYHKASNPSYERTSARPPAVILRLNAWLAEFCRSRRYTYIDYFSSMVDSSGMLQADVTEDGLHPNDKGYRIMARMVYDTLLKMFPPRSERRKR